MSKVGILLSGCGVNDGAEIHESVITMLALDRAGAEMVIMAPNIDQMHVINHFTGEEMDEVRNVLVEAARIARGNIRDANTVDSAELDALILPGGFGVAKNLSDYAMTGAGCEINPDVFRLVKEVHKAGKPVGVMCIAPTVMAKILGEIEESAKLTIGSDKNTASDIEVMGSEHILCPVDDIVVDQKMKIVSTPAYMEAHSIKEAAVGIEKLVSAVLELAN
ncbi:MAG: isoprenoid biosynthesis glyoxalase ElbB [Fidelibacterota bacterium]